MDVLDAIEEVRKLKAAAEEQIATGVQKALNGLEWRTGLSARGVRVEMAEVTNIQDERPRFVVERVEIDLGRI